MGRTATQMEDNGNENVMEFPAGNADDGETGYPAETKVSDMKPAEQAAYWKAQSRKHEGILKSLDGLTPAALAELREKADQHDALNRELMSDRDRAVLEAREAAAAEANATFAPRLVQAEFRVAAAGRVDGERLAKILEPLDLTKFLAADGSVDQARVVAYVDDVAPAVVVPGKRNGPSPLGLGHYGAPAGIPGSQGAAEADRRFGKSTTSN